MKSKRTIRLLVLLAVLSLLVGAPSGYAWQCQGQDCGVTPWSCCCEAHDGGDRDSCRHLAAAKTHNTCPPDCGCVLVAQYSDANHRGTPAFLDLTVEAPAVLTVVGDIYLPPAEVLDHVETRGPPVRTVTLLIQAQRGPPILTFSQIGI